MEHIKYSTNILIAKSVLGEMTSIQNFIQINNMNILHSP